MEPNTPGSWTAWLQGWRAILLSALAAAAVALPGLIALPVADRSEASFAQASAQMLEQQDFTAVQTGAGGRGSSAPGAHWAQAVSVSALSSPEARAIWAFRLPSLLGIMLFAAASAWGAGELFGRQRALAAGLICGCGLLVAALGAMATADALFCGASALTLAAFARLYCGRGGWGTQSLMWAGVIGGTLIEGLFMPGLCVLAGAALFAADRKAPWLRRMGWGWGLIAFLGVTGPWMMGVTVATDGGFWAREDGGFGGRAWPGLQTLALPLFLFPATALLPLVAVNAWKERNRPAVRVALAWLLPAGLLFELAPDRQVYDAAPLYVALAWLCSAAIGRPAAGWARMLAAGLSGAAGLALAAVCLLLSARFGQGAYGAVAGVAAVLFGLAGGLGGLAVLKGWRPMALAAVAAVGACAQVLLLGVLLPSLDPLWPTRQAVELLRAQSLDPRQGIVVGPVAATLGEPSLAFTLGAQVETVSADGAAAALEDGRPALVEARQAGAFRAALQRRGVRATPLGTVSGLNYVSGEQVWLTLYTPAGMPDPDPAPSGQ